MNIHLEIIGNMVINNLKISYNDLISRNQCKKLAYARHIISYLAVKENHSLSTIGNYLNRHYTTIINSKRQIENWSSTDVCVRKEILYFLDCLECIKNQQKATLNQFLSDNVTITSDMGGK